MHKQNKDRTQWYYTIHKLIERKVDDQDVYEKKIYQHVLPLQENYRMHSVTAKAVVADIQKGAKKITQADGTPVGESV